MDNLYVWTKKEFLYKLDNKYYLLGLYACEECQDQLLIELYTRFEDVCNCKQFECEVRDIPEYYKKDIADAFNSLRVACFVENSRMDYKAKALRDRLDERYEKEIEKQVERWIKAAKCADAVDR